MVSASSERLDVWLRTANWWEYPVRKCIMPPMSPPPFTENTLMGRPQVEKHKTAKGVARRHIPISIGLQTSVCETQLEIGKVEAVCGSVCPESRSLFNVR
jgi:hypothetical protein